MARWNFLFSKKRGQRRTGSNTLGRAGWGLFSAISFAVGAISLAFIVLKLSIPEWRVNHSFVETTCRVMDAHAGTDREGLTRPEIHIRFDAQGEEFEAWSHYDITGIYESDPKRTEQVLAKFHVGEEYPCWYDPRDPGSVVLARGYTWFAWLMLLVPGAFISVGGGGLIYTLLTWGKSSERLAATATQHPPGIDFFLPPQRAHDEEFPFLPDLQDWNNSPGTFLAYRLPAGTSQWGLWATALLCALWNGTVAIFLRMAINRFREGEPDWLLTVFVVPFAAIGILFILLLVRAVLITTGLGPTRVEISAHPLVPGAEYEVYVSQAGRVIVKSLAAKLICEEVSNYRQGTNTRRAARRVYEQVLVAPTAPGDEQRLPYEGRAALRVPADAMHSFKATHNRIEWKILVSGSIPRWPAFERSFPLVIRPHRAGENAA